MLMFAISKKSNDYCVIALRYFSTNTKIKLKKFKEITIALLCIKIKTQDMARRMELTCIYSSTIAKCKQCSQMIYELMSVRSGKQ